MRRSLVTSYGSGEYQAGEAHVMLSERLRIPGDNARLVVQCHGRGATALDGADQVYGKVAAELALRGYPVLCIDAGGKTTWGNDASRTAVANAIAWARQQRFNASSSKDPVIIGISMGGAVAFNYARTNPVKAVVSLIGAVDIDQVHDTNYNGFAAEIEAAYGGLAAYNAALPTHNPIAYLAPGQEARIYYSDDDPVTPAATQQAAAAALGKQAVSIGAIGHSIAGVDPVAVADYVQAVAAL